MSQIYNNPNFYTNYATGVQVPVLQDFTIRSGAREAEFCSELDNKETFLHRPTPTATASTGHRAYTTTEQRKRNLTLANKLDQSPYSTHEEVNKTIRSLRWCGQNSIIEENQDNNLSIFRTSGSCKSPHCTICQARKAAKISTRLSNYLNSTAYTDNYSDNYFYFLTLTLKHNSTTRSDFYLEELQQYLRKLYRTKAFKDLFNFSTNTKKSGFISNIELTITQNGFHLHSHILISCPRLTLKIKEAENLIRAEWFRLTKDSTVISLDLVKNRSRKDTSETYNYTQTDLFSAVKEITKYQVKTSDPNQFTDVDVDLYCTFLIESKGKNFLNTHGLFRGISLTSYKSKFDTKENIKVQREDCKYYIARTVDIKFNKYVSKALSKQDQKELLSDIKIIALPLLSIDVTNIMLSAICYMDYKLDTDLIFKSLADLNKPPDTPVKKSKSEIPKQQTLFPLGYSRN